MATDRGNETRVVFSDGSMDPDSGRAAGMINAAAPLIIGLVAPILVFLLIDPSVLLNAPFLVSTILLPLLGFSVAVYAYSVLNPGDVAGVIVDREKRYVELVQANFFATRRTTLAFGEIASVRMASEYDQDGYAEPRAELILETGETVALASITSAAELQALKAALGRR